MAGEANGARASSGEHTTPTHVDSSPGFESDSEVNSTIDLLDTEVRELYVALDNQKRLLKEAARERRKLRSELGCAREKSSEDECPGCISHKNDLVALRAKHDENVANLDCKEARSDLKIRHSSHSSTSLTMGASVTSSSSCLALASS